MPRPYQEFQLDQSGQTITIFSGSVGAVQPLSDTITTLSVSGQQFNVIGDYETVRDLIANEA